MNPNEHLTRKRRLASLLWPKYQDLTDRANRNVEFLDFIRESPAVPVFCDTHDKHDRHEFFLFLNEKILQGGAIDYLEFGVWEGASIREWCELNREEESRFFGFDSFEGLPEDWHASKEGMFRVSALPQFVDPRVSLVKGWFQDTVPAFVKDFRTRHRLVVHIDCDLYSSTLFALTQLDCQLKAGSIIIFDEFSDLLHEFRAFRDYRQAYRREFGLLGVTEGFLRVAVEVK